MYPDRAYDLFALWEKARDDGTRFSLDDHNATPEEREAFAHLIAELSPQPVHQVDDKNHELPPATARYRFDEFIARGGMGEVYRGEDTVLKRTVALKVLRRRLGVSPEKFRHEAQLVARLTHPGIVPIHDLDQLPDGRPFFAMKLVEGKTFEDVIGKCNAQSPELPRWLQYFEQICQAVAYAHSQTPPLLHRDLKPQNVMIGAYGEVLVMDWGIARVVAEGTGSTSTRPSSPPATSTDSTVDQSQSDSAEGTAPGVAKGTVAYMPPEQARGERDQIGPWSDVFALGGILCRILTGKATFVGAEGWTRAAAGDLAEPLERLDRSGADSELIAIARRCLAADIHQRPANAGAVTKLVATFRQGVEDRLRQAETARAASEAKAQEQRKRWRQLMAAAGIIAAVLVLGIAGTLIGLFEARRQAGEATREAGEKEIALQAERDANRHAYKSMGLLTHQVVDNLLGKQTALSPEDRAFLRNVQSYWEQFADRQGDSFEAKELAAEGNSRVALVRYRLGESVPAEANLRKAVAIREELASARPDEIQQKTLAQALSELGQFLFQTGKVPEAEVAMRRALTLQAKFGSDTTSPADDRAHLASTRSSLAIVLKHTGRTTEATALAKQALHDRKRLVAEQPDSIEYAQLLAHSHINFAALLSEAGRDADSEIEYGSAQKIQEQLTATHPELTQVRLELARSHYSLGNRHKDAGHLAKAKESYARALAIQQNLVAQYPARPLYQDELGLTMLNMGTVCADRGETTEAEAALRKANALLEQVHMAHPEVTDYRRDLAAAHHQYGNMLFDAGQTDLAAKEYAFSLEQFRKLVAELPDAPEFRECLASSLKSQCRVLQLRGAPETEKLLAEAADIQMQLAKEHPDRLDAQLAALKEQRELASILLSLGKTKAAVDGFRSTVASLEELEKSFPDRHAIKDALVEAYTKTAKAYSLANLQADATALLSKAIELGKQLSTGESVRPTEMQHLAVAYWELAVLQRELGDADKARTICRQAESLMKKLCEENPKHVSFRDQLASIESDLGGMLLEAGQLDEATNTLMSSLTIRTDLLEKYPSRLGFRGTAARTESNLAIALARNKKIADAEIHFKRAIELKTPEAEAFANQPHHQQQLAQYLSNYGTLLQDLKKPAEAEATQRKALAIHESLVKMEPARLDYQFALAGSEVNFGLLLVGNDKPAESIKWFDRGIDRLNEIRKKLPRHPAVLEFLANGHGAKGTALEKLSRFKEAVDFCRSAVEVAPPARRKVFQTQLGRALALAGEPAQAIPIAEELLRGTPSGDDCYDAACIFSLCAKSTNEQQVAKKHQDRALALLQEAEKKGRFATESIRADAAKDTDLDPLRSRPEFQDWWKKLNAAKETQPNTPKK